jgi:seryl-tRNA synthetase
MTLRMASATSEASHSRTAANGKSLDVNLMATEPELVTSHLKARRAAEGIFDDVARIATLREQRSTEIQKGDKAKSDRKTLSQEIGKMMKEGKSPEEVDVVKGLVAAASSISAECDLNLGKIDTEIDSILACIPNLLDDDVPDGSDDVDNSLVRSWREDVRKIGQDGDYLWHDEIATKVGGLDVEGAARISGARFSILQGPVARMERALTQFFLDYHTGNGYKEVSVPFIVSRSTLKGTGQLPKFEDDLFKVSHSVAGEDAFMIPTAEVPVTSIYRDQLLNVDDLPVSLVCASPSFRAEAGSYGRDTRGLLRQHQFHKVELVKIVKAESSEEAHQGMVKDAEAVLEALELPYRTMLLCSGDIGFSARKCYDIEVWLPGQQEYREIASISNCHDFQSRRMSLRHRTLPQGAEKTKGEKGVGKAKTTAYPHTLNGSGVAVGRALVAVLENYQQPDGSVVVPQVLRPYMGGMEIIKPV